MTSRLGGGVPARASSRTPADEHGQRHAPHGRAWPRPSHPGIVRRATLGHQADGRRAGPSKGWTGGRTCLARHFGKVYKHRNPVSSKGALYDPSGPGYLDAPPPHRHAASRPAHHGQRRGDGPRHGRGRAPRSHGEPHRRQHRGHADRDHERRRRLSVPEPPPRLVRPDLRADRLPHPDQPRPARRASAARRTRARASRSASAASRSRWWPTRRWWTRSPAR